MPRLGFHTTSSCRTFIGRAQAGPSCGRLHLDFLMADPSQLLCDGHQLGIYTAGPSRALSRWVSVFLWWPGRALSRFAPADTSGTGDVLCRYQSDPSHAFIHVCQVSPRSYTSMPSWVFVRRAQPDYGENARRLGQGERSQGSFLQAPIKVSTHT